MNQVNYSINADIIVVYTLKLTTKVTSVGLIEIQVIFDDPKNCSGR